MPASVFHEAPVDPVDGRLLVGDLSDGKVIEAEDRRSGAGQEDGGVGGDEKFLCLNPDPEKQGTRIERMKYEQLREAILSVVPPDENGLYFKDLSDEVESYLGAEKISALGSVGWYTTTVKLDLEARGEIERVPGSSPQRIRRSR